MSVIREFKEFAFKGNVLDMAVGVIVGSAFGKIVSSIVSDIFMPIFSGLTAGIQFTDFKIHLRGDSYIMLGNFIQNVVDFLIIAVSIFMVVKFANHFKAKEEPPKVEAESPTQEELLTQIRDLLKERQ